jgi:hypothetical protein
MDKISFTIIGLTVLLILLNFLEKYLEKRDKMEGFTANVFEKIPKIKDPEDKFLLNPETVLSSSPMFKQEQNIVSINGDVVGKTDGQLFSIDGNIVSVDDGSHRGELDFFNQLPSPYQHFGNRNQIYDFSMYGDQPFVQCAKCKQKSNCVAYPNTTSDKHENICTECKKPATIQLVREIGYYPPEIQARAIGYPRLCVPS